MRQFRDDMNTFLSFLFITGVAFGVLIGETDWRVYLPVGGMCLLFGATTWFIGYKIHKTEYFKPKRKIKSVSKCETYSMKDSNN